MAIKPRDKRHSLQIRAGITGRLKGHSFEEVLSKSINDSATALCIPGHECSSHIYKGDPATILAAYVLQHFGIKKADSVKAFWLGGLATSGKGDTVLGVSGEKIKRSKSDLLLEIVNRKQIRRVGVSVKTCFRPKPTNAQLFCSTAHAFCELLRRNGIAVSERFESGLKMFCGDEGFRPVDSLKPAELRKRVSDPDRWFFEEIPKEAQAEIKKTFSKHQDSISRALLQMAYPNDPFPPEFVMHQMHSAESASKVPLAIFHMEELIGLSKAYAGFVLKPYLVRKGRYKGDPNTHLAPRFGCIQFQRLGNKQNATQLQFNLEAGYFTKITQSSKSRS